MDVSDSSKYGVNDYLRILAGFGLENTIRDFTREESRRTIITYSRIDHVVVTLSNLKHFSGIHKQNVADHYSVPLNVTAEPQNKKIRIFFSTYFENKLVDKPIPLYYRKVLLEQEPSPLYREMATKFEDIYSRVLRT